MGEAKNLRGRPTKRLRELADEVGYSPGEVSVQVFAYDGRTIKRWLKDLSRGLVPEDLGHMRLGAASEFVYREARAYVDRERQWMEFFEPKQKAVESNVNLSGEVSLVDLLKAKRDGDTG
jgi:hypothetical protein